MRSKLLYQGRRHKTTMSEGGGFISNNEVIFEDHGGDVHGDLPLRLDLANHSPTGFEWGYKGSGPAQLALAILAHFLGDDKKAFQLYQWFKQDMIAPLSREAWTIRAGDIVLWLFIAEARGLCAARGLEFSVAEIEAAAPRDLGDLETLTIGAAMCHDEAEREREICALFRLYRATREK